MFNHLFAEFASTALMIVFGVGVHRNITLKGSKYRDSGHMFAITTWSFGISVCLFIFGGVCMNPAMALCQAIVGLIPWSSLAPYAIAEMLGGVAGACIAWLIYADDFRASEGEVDPVAIRNIFSTNPHRSPTTWPATSSSRRSTPSSSSPASSRSRRRRAITCSRWGSAWDCSSGPWAWA